MTMKNVLENILKLVGKEIEGSEFDNEIVCAFADMEIDEWKDVIVSENKYGYEAYINAEDAPSIIIRTENRIDNDELYIKIVDAWIN